MREYNFDGLVGPTHNFAGLSPGNLASTSHAGEVSNPRSAALQGLAKMRFVASLGIGQAVLPPQPRPDVGALRRLGFTGDDATVLARAAEGDGQLLRLCSSASSMWTANAATVAPSADTADGRVHLTPANLSSMFHRALEARVTSAVLRRIFADPDRFVVHDPLPPGEHFADEGAANHTRLATSQTALHVLAWGRSTWGGGAAPTRFPARHSREASSAISRLHALPAERVLLWQQSPEGIDAGAFHTDVLAVGNGSFLMLHEAAFVDHEELFHLLSSRLGPDFSYCLAGRSELPVADAVTAYPFNSQLVTLPSGSMAIIAPRESERNARTRRFLERVVAEENPVDAAHYIDVNESMNNGGGPACLRLRMPLTNAEREATGARVFLDDALFTELTAWVERHYRDRLVAADLADPALLVEVHTALDELTRLLALGPVYDFQQSA